MSITVLELMKHVRAQVNRKIKRWHLLMEANGRALGVFVCCIMDNVAAELSEDGVVLNDAEAVWREYMPEGKRASSGWWPQTKEGHEARLAALDKCIADLEDAQ